MLASTPIPESAERRAALSVAVTARTGLDPAAIERFLRAFYGAARQDTLLGPAFAGVADWERHIAVITRFWCSVALMTGDYHGQPMQAHAHLALQPAHFRRWLALFEQVAGAELTPQGAEHMLERARRIARSLEMGLLPLPLPATPRPTAQGQPA
ncbi:group III truncated hemoglobin [Roseomonas sp. AR75]|uniref:group III truncated hemoglobin n=1 Tax=Roseomonas sp. AR75 TaxID=2562311 RepID=UPI001F0CF3DF|nr:group III truncated hemoglobin [Roseomonas sp. AR75]